MHRRAAIYFEQRLSKERKDVREEAARSLNGLLPSETKQAVDPASDAEYQRGHPKHVDALGDGAVLHVT
jgi:hypothetical protein